MRLDIRSQNRLGITQEVLSVFANHGIDVRAVDMITHHIYVDAPDITVQSLQKLAPDLDRIDGVGKILKTTMLPSERRRAQLTAVFSAITEPLLAVSKHNRVLLANSSALAVFGFHSEDSIKGVATDELLGPAIAQELLNDKFHSDEREVRIKNQPLMMHSVPFGLHKSNGKMPAGGVVIFQSPARIGRIVSALQNQAGDGFDAIIGDSPIMHSVKERAMRVAMINAPLLIQGETGTGKEMFARACHRASERRTKPLIALNCAALPESLAESELFGYESGAFTSASKGGKPGLLELADGGSVFLDEVSELSLYLQAKLLRFLQDGSYRRIGGKLEKKIDVRIISATNRDLATLSDTGEFRSDLLFRLNVLNINTPPLRERLQDIPLLALAFVQRSTARIGRPPVRLSGEAIDKLLEISWPGNVRELENVLFRSVSLLDGNVLTAADLYFDGNQLGEQAADMASNGDLPDYASALAAFERQYFQQASQLQLSTRQLAERIGVSHATVARKLRKYV